VGELGCEKPVGDAPRVGWFGSDLLTTAGRINQILGSTSYLPLVVCAVGAPCRGRVLGLVGMLAALSDAPSRVVVLTRSPEMIQAARKARLVGAVAVQLHHVPDPMPPSPARGSVPRAGSRGRYRAASPPGLPPPVAPGRRHSDLAQTVQQRSQ